MDAGEPLDGAAVDGDLVVYGLLDLGGGDGHVFGLAKNIGKLHADEVYALFLHHADNIFFGVLAHMVGSPFEMKKRTSKLRIPKHSSARLNYSIPVRGCQEKIEEGGYFPWQRNRIWIGWWGMLPFGLGAS